ncbi:hypothetical protein CVT24_009759 [Panaeolus cyanescens]|uniref:Uncharacterized protein n=1 Tax=Panaeolus cyanescens TaxID=181874 RepID=A0A409WF59_9AGAR|nr:hypothetical protein CVT24_009759 [Panaeolus cyanescens]
MSSRFFTNDSFNSLDTPTSYPALSEHFHTFPMTQTFSNQSNPSGSTQQLPRGNFGVTNISQASTDAVASRSFKRRRDRRNARRSIKRHGQTQTREVDDPMNVVEVSNATVPPPPPPPIDNGRMVIADDHNHGPSVNAINGPSISTPMTDDALRLCLYGLASPLHIILKATDLITIHFENNRKGFGIDQTISTSLWMALQRLHTVVVQAAAAYAEQRFIVDPFSGPLPAIVPDDLFVRLNLERPAILSKIEPSKTNPLFYSYPSTASAISSWTFYQKLALETMEWIRLAYNRSFNVHPALTDVSNILRIDNEFGMPCVDNSQALVLHPTASQYAQEHVGYNPYNGSIVFDATL